jgi:hypothetical protein
MYDLKSITMAPYFLFAFSTDGIGIAISPGRPKAVVPIADLPSRWDQTGRVECDQWSTDRVSIEKEGVLPATTNNDTQFPHGTQDKHCVPAVCDSSGAKQRPHAAGELR